MNILFGSSFFSGARAGASFRTVSSVAHRSEYPQIFGRLKGGSLKEEPNSRENRELRTEKKMILKRPATRPQNASEIKRPDVLPSLPSLIDLCL
jgi:hypothetical protein